MKKSLFLFTLGLIAGFFIHALIFPDLFSNGIFILPQVPTNALNAPSSQNSGTAVIPAIPMETIISYTGTNFSRTNIRMQSGRYVTIVNESPTEKMDLISSVADLRTPRPYAYKEQVRTRIDKIGTYVVADRNNPSIRLVITTK